MAAQSPTPLVVPGMVTSTTKPRGHFPVGLVICDASPRSYGASPSIAPTVAK